MNAGLVIDHDALPEVCVDDTHVNGCPCRAGGDAEYVTARLSYVRCSECGDLLEADGSCDIHGLLDPEASDA